MFRVRGRLYQLFRRLLGRLRWWLLQFLPWVFRRLFQHLPGMFGVFWKLFRKLQRLFRFLPGKLPELLFGQLYRNLYQFLYQLHRHLYRRLPDQLHRPVRQRLHRREPGGADRSSGGQYRHWQDHHGERLHRDQKRDGK